MKIDLSTVDLTQFMKHDHVVNGEVLTLVQPQFIGAKWNKDNLHFRSSVWNYEGELVSASFKKFFNAGEQPELSPLPTNLKKCKFVQKLDGSTLIVSKYKGNFILRTRGTVDASGMEKNGHEIEQFKSIILPKIDNEIETWDYSVIFEWVSPLNRVVLLYPEPKWYLIGVVNHSDYSLVTQESLDEMAQTYGLLRPPIYSFDDVTSLQDIIKKVEAWVGIEGIVIYSDNGQSLHKSKGLDYLARHRLKSELGSFEKLVDFWITLGKVPDFHTFYSEVEKLTDYETVQEHYGDISRIIDAWKEVQKIVAGMQKYVTETLKPLPTRRDQAVKVLGAYGVTNRASFVFALLNGKSLSDEQLKKLMFQVLKR